MIVLGFDTATSATAVALRRTDGTVSEARDDPPTGAHPGHATRLLRMSDELLRVADVAPSAIDRIAVGTGPGTFTGLRVGLATARGLAQSSDAELVGISSLRALAAPALAAGRPVLAAIDARRGEVFTALYGPDGEALTEPRALAPTDLAALVAEAGAAEPPLAVGDGVLRYPAEVRGAGAEPAAESSPLHLVSAGAVCALGLGTIPGPYAEVVPDYLRRPDAELALARRGGDA